MLRSATIFVLTTLAGLFWRPPISIASDQPSFKPSDLGTTIVTGDQAYRSIDICGRGCFPTDDSGTTSFRVRYSARDGFCLLFVDESDDTPIMYLNNKQLVIYNAVDGAVVYLSNATFAYTLRCEDGKLNQIVSISKSGPSTILINVESLFNTSAEAVGITTVGEFTIRLTRRLADGRSILAVVDRSEKPRIRRIDVPETGASNPPVLSCALSDDDSKRDWPVLPSKDALGHKLPLQDWTNDVFLETSALSGFMSRALLARPAIRNKRLRASYECEYGVGIDWRRVEANDRRISCALRESIPGLVNIGRRKTRDKEGQR
jgi:hypothetical protein